MAQTTVRLADINKVRATLYRRILAGINETADEAHDIAVDLVPVRKVFATGTLKSGRVTRGRQETRPLSLREALNESITRRRLGMPSAFPTDESGRRIPGSQSLVRTALFKGGYRTKNRANREARNVDPMARRQAFRLSGENVLGDLVEVEPGITRVVRNEEAEAALTVEGRKQLRNLQIPQGGRTTLGGALRQTVVDGLTPARAELGDHWEATISAGSDEVDYAKYVEFGTRRSRAQPYLRPALAHAREVLYQKVLNQLSGKK